MTTKIIFESGRKVVIPTGSSIDKTKDLELGELTVVDSSKFELAEIQIDQTTLDTARKGRILNIPSGLEDITKVRTVIYLGPERGC